MSQTEPDVTSALITDLAASLRPVRRLAPPGWRALAWLGTVIVVGVALATQADLPAVAERVFAAPDMWLAMLGSVLTAGTGAVAAVMLALPDRDGRWALLPLPAAALWLAASGWGCLRTDALALLHPASMAEATQNCLPFILKTSVVLALPLGFLLWRARPERIGLVSWIAGLALAAASASLLWLAHPFDASLADLLVHVAAVGIVALGSRLVAFLLPD